MSTNNGRNAPSPSHSQRSARTALSPLPPARPVGLIKSCSRILQSCWDALCGPLGRPVGQNSQCAAELAAVAKKHPEYKAIIEIIEEVVTTNEVSQELLAAINEKKKRWEAEKNSLAIELNTKNRELNSKNIRIESLLKENKEKEMEDALKLARIEMKTQDGRALTDRKEWKVIKLKIIYNDLCRCRTRSMLLSRRHSSGRWSARRKYEDATIQKDVAGKGKRKSMVNKI